MDGVEGVRGKEEKGCLEREEGGRRLAMRERERDLRGGEQSGVSRV